MAGLGPPRLTQLLTVILVLGLLGIGAAGIDAVADDDTTDLFTEATTLADLASDFTPDDQLEPDSPPDDLPENPPDDVDLDDLDPPDEYNDSFGDLEALEEMAGDLSPEDLEEYAGDELGEYPIPDDPNSEQLAAAAALSMHPGIVLSELELTDDPEYWAQHTYSGVHEHDRLSDTITQQHSDDLASLPTVEEFSGDFAGDRRTHTVQLDQQTAILPVPGEATGIEILDGPAADLRQLPNGMVLSVDSDGELAPLPEGTEYLVETITRPQPDTTLPEDVSSEQASRDDSYIQNVIVDEYLEAGEPRGEPNRLYEETAPLVSEDDSWVEVINTLSMWLHDNGEYTLDADPDGIGEDLEGHSLTYASELASALRFHDIPTRVAVGYDAINAAWDGDPTVVRAMDRHAWTEVYIPGHGWLAVDPTPAQQRTDTYQKLAAGNESLDEEGIDDDVLDEWDSLRDAVDNGDTDAVPDPAEPPEDDEDPPDEDPPEEDPPDDDDEDQPPEDDDEDQPPEDDDDELPPGITDIEYLDDPVPGGQLTVQTLYEGEPVPGAEVFFDGASIGITDDDGTVTGDVPYMSDLTVTATHPDDSEPSANAVTSQSTDENLGTLSSSEQPDINRLSEDTTVEDEIDLPTDVDLTTPDLILPGDEIALTFYINETPVEEATVQFNDQPFGTTDSDGTITAEIPETATPGSTHEISVTRGEIEATETIDLAELELSIDAAYLPIVSLPGEVSAEFVGDGDSVPVDNESVTLADSDGEFDTVTVENGSAAFEFPLTNTVTAEMTAFDEVTPAQYDNIFLWNAGAGLVGMTVLGIGATSVYRRRERLRGVIDRIVAVPFWIADKGMAFARWLSGLAIRLQQTIRSWIDKVLAGQYLLVLREFALSVISLPFRVVAGLVAAVRRLWQRALQTRVGQELSDAADRITDETGTGQLQRSAYERIRRYWRWLVRVTIGRTRARTKTSEEVASYAQQQGFPDRAVTTLRRSFQDVEYGQKDPSDRVQDAESAHERLQSTEEEDAQ